MEDKPIHHKIEARQVDTYFVITKKMEEERERTAMLQRVQLEQIVKSGQELDEAIKQYRSVIEQEPRDYDLLFRLEKKVDQMIEEYAGSKIYINCP